MLKFVSPYFWIKVVLYFYKKRKFKSVGLKFRFDPFSYFSESKIDVGDYVYIGPNSYVSAYLALESNIMIGPNVTILGGDHYFGVKGKWVRFIKPKEDSNNQKILIEKDVWIGANVTILKGVKIGMGSVIAAGSVVVKNIPPYVVVAGLPARPIKKIFTAKKLKEHLKELGKNDFESEEIISKRKDFEKLPAVDNTKLSEGKYTYHIVRERKKQDDRR